MPEEKLKRLAGDIGQGRFAPFYLFEGPDEYRKQRALDALRSALLGEKADAGAAENLGPAKAAEVCERARTVPFFLDKRLLLAAGVENYVDADLAALELYAAAPADSTAVVFWCGGNLDRRKKLWKFFEKRDAAFTFLHLTGAARRNRLAAEAKRLGARLTDDALAYLDNALGPDLYTIVRELEKIATYADGAELDAAAVSNVAAASRVESAYDMVKYVGEGKAGPALAAIRKLLLAGERAESLVGLLARQIRLIWLAQVYGNAGLSRGEIASRLGVAPYFVGEYAEAARRIPGEKLASLHHLLASLDVGIKTGRVGPELALELFAARAAVET